MLHIVTAHGLRIRVLFLLLAVLTLEQQCWSLEPEVVLYGQRKLRAAGVYVEPIFASDRHAVVYDQNGEITVFDLRSGDVANVAYTKVLPDQYVADTAFSSKHNVFAVAVGRKVEIRKTDSPNDILRTVEMPEVDLSDYFTPPTLKIDFNAGGDRIVVYDKATQSLLSFDLATGVARIERGDLVIDYPEDMVVTSSGDVWLLESEVLHQLGTDGRLQQHAVSDRQRYQAMKVEDKSVFLVCKYPSSTLLGPSGYVIKEFAISGFEEKQTWDCDSRALAVVANRPVFRRGGAIYVGAADGSVQEILKCTQNINQLFASLDGKRLFAKIPGGLRYWSTATWEPDPWFSQPTQLDQILAVNDTGELVALTDLAVYRSAAGGVFTESRQLPPMLNQSGQRSLAADGRALAFLTAERGVFHLQLGATDSGKALPRKLAIPNNALPSEVSISEKGDTVAVRFNPKLSLDDPESGERAVAQAFQSGVSGGLFSQMFGVATLTESCAIFKLDGTEPIVGLIGRDALLSTGTPYLNNGQLHWAGESEVGSWRFEDEAAKPQTRSIKPGEIIGLSSFNELGDIIFRRTNDNNPDGIRARIFWLGASQRHPVELAMEKKEDSETYVAALADNGKHVYIGKSSAYRSTIAKVLLPEQQVLWKVDLPSRLLYLRLSPNGKYLGAKLSDSRYALISKLGD